MKNPFTLIPRTRVNYSFSDIVQSLIVREKSSCYKDELISILSGVFNTDNIVLTSSGRSALYELLCVLPQHKVLIPSYTCKAVVETCLFAEKEIVYAKVDINTFNLVSEGIDKLIDSDTIVIATHQYGVPCEIKKIIDLSKKKNAIVIEDCAASFGSSVDGKLCGLWGDYSFFSFDSSKLITLPPKGGFIIGRNVEILDKIRAKEERKQLLNKLSTSKTALVYWILKNKFIYQIFHYLFLEKRNRWQLNDAKELCTHIGGHYFRTMSQIQAFYAIKQFHKIDSIINKRKEVYKYFHENINESLKVKLPPMVIDACPIRFAIIVDNKDIAYKFFVDKGVDMAFSFSHVFCPEHFKEAHYIATSVLDIPFYYDLSKKEIDKIIEVINEYSSK